MAMDVQLLFIPFRFQGSLVSALINVCLTYVFIMAGHFGVGMMESPLHPPGLILPG